MSRNGKVSTDLYRKYRPTCWEEVVGQDSAIKQLKGWLKKGEFPHSLLLTGATGVGKTTIARILKQELKCSDADYDERNTAQVRGIDDIRKLSSLIHILPMYGRCRIWVLDEAHGLSKQQGGNAQEALLKVLEELPSHVYFFLCTTNPDGLIRTLRGRCHTVALKDLSEKLLRGLVEKAAEKEEVTLDEEVLDLIVEIASEDGGARQALTLLSKVMTLESEEEQLEAIRSARLSQTSVFLGQMLLGEKTTWPDVARVLKDTKEDAEGLRRGILGYAMNALLRNPKKINPRAAHVLEVFEGNLFNTGKPGLVLMCLNFFHSGS